MASARTYLTRALVPVNAISLGIAIATFMATGMFVATLLLVAQGGPPSTHLGLLSQYFPGYSVSIGGAFVGAFWAAAVGFVGSTLAALPYYRGVLARVRETSRSIDVGRLGTDVARLQVPHFPIAIGTLCGFTVMTASVLLLLNHSPDEPLGPHLGLIRQFLPGFRVSWIGSLGAFAYFFVIGALVATCVAWLYNRRVGSSGTRGAK
jgi:hypothetical protein